MAMFLIGCDMIQKYITSHRHPSKIFEKEPFTAQTGRISADFSGPTSNMAFILFNVTHPDLEQTQQFYMNKIICTQFFYVT
ncbi:MAG: hypothetical protein J6T54_13345 [Fibrobacter sp.]|nr:hypothetical protein [Fibrobacter sp.]